jgi:putative FmdB family regulatory protein
VPIYSYHCCICDRVEDALRPVKDYDKPLDCSCGAEMHHVLSFSNVKGPNYPFIDNYMDARPIEIQSLKHYRKELRKRNLQECGRGKGNKGQWV